MLEETDYSKIGLKIGLEIHQQLDTKRKLFCRCPPLLRKDAPYVLIKRKLHAVAGESGEVDVAAAYQHSLDKEFVYEGYLDSTCLIEYDDSPPDVIDQEALNITLQVALLLNCKILPITQIMRKTVVDGSNTSGFQRTVLIARDGFVETHAGKVGIASICLEEDSARAVGEKNQEDKVAVYRLDRLGIPLIEIATEPDIKTPEQAKEVALHIGEILRSCKVKRGIGTIRQDVNLSIKGGKRIELKGFQDIMNIEKAVETEVKRQIELVKSKKSVSEVRKVFPDGKSEFLRPMPGASRMYPETDLPLLKISRLMIDNAKKTLPKMRRELEEELETSGLNREMITLLLKQGKVEEFKELLHIINNPNLIAKVLLVYSSEIASREKISLEKVEKILNKDVLGNVLESLKKKKISEGDLKSTLTRIVQGEEYENIVNQKKEDSESAEEKVMKIIKSKPGLSFNAYMGLVMKELGNKVSGKDASEIIKKYVK
jgi:Glu-tRNA(Gln) amidotransferase subunit E-like FAD-binding protein